MAIQDPNIRAATLSSSDAHGNILNNDYIIVGPDQSSVLPSFLPEAQTLEFIFTLFPDDIAEDTEAFQATSSPTEGENILTFTAPVNLSASTFIVIEDNDCTFFVNW